MQAQAPSQRRIRIDDGTEVAFSVEGGGPAMVLTNGLTTTHNFWKYLHPHLCKSYRVLSWDLPGHGASGPALSAKRATLDGQPEVITQLMDATNMEQAVHIGWSTGCQVVLEFYRRYPARCTSLVLLLGSAGHVLSTSALPLPGPAIDWMARRTPPSVFAVATALMARVANTPLGQFLSRRVGLIGQDTTVDDAKEITEHLCRVDAHTVQHMVASAEAHSAWDILPAIKVPVLVVAGDQDPFAPASKVGIPMAKQIPNASLLRLPTATHTALLDHAEAIGEAIREFLMRTGP